jgi:hypothetical protein
MPFVVDSDSMKHQALPGIKTGVESLTSEGSVLYLLFLLKNNAGR